MILAIDVYYRNDVAKAAGVLLKNFKDEEPIQTYTKIITNMAEYTPGEFYKRELPCITELLQLISISSLQCIIIDGYVFLNDQQKPGLGYHLYLYLNKQVPIIGVAKTNFYNNQKYVRTIIRGKSKTPLYITSIGIDVDIAAVNILSMAGEHRIPNMLKRVDMETKKNHF